MKLLGKDERPAGDLCWIAGQTLDAADDPTP
jgi:hypothetical protein